MTIFAISYISYIIVFLPTNFKKTKGLPDDSRSPFVVMMIYVCFMQF